MNISLSFPLDRAGFLRRACPHCEREFKWLNTEQETDVAVESPNDYYCPYCHEPANPDDWWTKEQSRYVERVTAYEVEKMLQREVKRSFGRGMAITGTTRAPAPLSETDEMVRVEMPCHPDEPIKIKEEWWGPVACLVCGIRYPVNLVRVLLDDLGAEHD